ncbi:MAG TPA: SelB C-terminal domain-containing protein, partial [Tepidisphaeraceae bacterium]
GSIDLALLVVAADDGWMPQTEEHLQILTYLGVEHAVVALTKSDLATDLDSAIAMIRARLQESPLAHAPIIPTSVTASTGIEALKGAMAQVLSQTPPPCDIGKPRLAVDRVFSLKGIGTVVTGTLTGGALRRGQGVVIEPWGLRTHIRSVQTHNREVEQGLAGSRVALNLPDLKPASGRRTRGSASVGRGDVVTIPEVGGASSVLDVLIERTQRHQQHDEPARPLKDGTIVRVHHGSGAFAARVSLLEGEQVPAGGRVIARLVPDHPVFAFSGDRFVIRDWPEQHTLAGGVVLDADAPGGGFRKQKRRDLLTARAGNINDINSYVASRIKHDGISSRSMLLAKSRFTRHEIDAALSQLHATQTIVLAGDAVADARWWQAVRVRAVQAIDEHHAKHPEHNGLPLADLRQLLDEAAIADAVIGELCRDGFVKTAAAIRRSSHRPTLPPRLAGPGARIRGTLSAKPFDPPSRREIAPDDTSFQALKFLVSSGEVVEISPEVVLGSDAFNTAVQKVQDHLKQHQAATVSELKTLLNSSRRIMVPLLEKLDRDGITRRDGDRRMLRST